MVSTGQSYGRYGEDETLKKGTRVRRRGHGRQPTYIIIKRESLRYYYAENEKTGDKTHIKVGEFKPALQKKKNPQKGRGSIPSKLVCLGKCLEIEFSDGTLYEPPGADLCASMSGKTLYVVKRRKATKTRKRNALFEAFHDFDPDSEYVIRIPDNINFKKSKKVRSISYRSNKWTGKNVDYIHRFRSHPTAYSDNLKKPSIIKISGGKIRVKPQGITG